MKFGQSIAQEAQKSTMLGQKSTVIMIHQGLLKIHQDSKVAKLGFCRKSQLNFDQA